MSEIREYTEEDVSRQTDYAKYYSDEHIKNSMEFLTDSNKKKRLELGKCKFCFYLHGSGFSGQAISKWNCKVCNDPHVHENTSVPKICYACSDIYELCTVCGGDVEMRMRRKKKLKETK